MSLCTQKTLPESLLGLSVNFLLRDAHNTLPKLFSVVFSCYVETQAQEKCSSFAEFSFAENKFVHILA